MKLPAMFTAASRANAQLPYARLFRGGPAPLRFDRPLEREFREFYEQQNLPRVRFSLVVATAVVLTVGLAEHMLQAVHVDARVNLLRLGLLLPLLGLCTAAAWLPIARRHHTALMALGVLTIGTVVIYMAQLGALSGQGHVLMGPMLVVLYACLFLGLLFGSALALSICLLLLYVSVGLQLGLPAHQLVYSTLVLAVSAIVGVYSAYSFERLLRSHFVEARFLNELAERDGLTGLYNRRIFDDLITRIWRQARREDAAIEIIFIDIDYFKVYNDMYGHQAGDDCLKSVARTIARAAKRPFDFAARYGGEEFVLVLYGPPSDYGRLLPERIRLDVAGLRIEHEGSGIASSITVSVGVAHARPVDGRSLAGAIQAADEALYEAKRLGRNRVEYRDANASDVETGKFRTAYRQSVS